MKETCNYARAPNHPPSTLFRALKLPLGFMTSWCSAWSACHRQTKMCEYRLSSASVSLQEGEGLQIQRSSAVHTVQRSTHLAALPSPRHVCSFQVSSKLAIFWQYCCTLQGGQRAAQDEIQGSPSLS